MMNRMNRVGTFQILSAMLIFAIVLVNSLFRPFFAVDPGHVPAARQAEEIVADVLPDDPRCKIVLDPGSESAADEMSRLGKEVFGEDNTNGIGKPDSFSLGPCRYFYPKRVKPESGFTADFDWYFFRTTSPEIKRREGCFVRCLELMEKMEDKDFEFGQEMLTAAAFMGLTEASRVLVERHGLDPIGQARTARDDQGDQKRRKRRALGEDQAPDVKGVSSAAVEHSSVSKAGKKKHRKKRHLSNSADTSAGDCRLNAMQAALMGGYVDIVKILSGGDYSRIIDDHNRTVEDYVRLKGSPVRPYYARTVLGIDVKDDDHDKSAGVASEEGKLTSKYPEDGWNSTMSRPDIDYSCDFEVVDTDVVDLDRDTFLRDYYLPGRPVVLRNAVSKEEMSTFNRSAWEKLGHFHPTQKHRVGVTAYPSLSMQKGCSYHMSAEQIERDERCRDTPQLHMMHAEHDKNFDEAYGMYDGDPTRPGGGFSKPVEYFPGVGLSWQIFFGSDMSGATLHWHAAAFNILYVGTKEWHVTPPLYRGFTGMPAEVALERFANQPFGVRCTQLPGDLIYIPDHWGHLTLNHGFGIGVASIVKQRQRGVPGAV